MHHQVYEYMDTGIVPALATDTASISLQSTAVIARSIEQVTVILTDDQQ